MDNTQATEKVSTLNSFIEKKKNGMSTRVPSEGLQWQKLFMLSSEKLHINI